MDVGFELPKAILEISSSLIQRASCISERYRQPVKDSIQGFLEMGRRERWTEFAVYGFIGAFGLNMFVLPATPEKMINDLIHPKPVKTSLTTTPAPYSLMQLPSEQIGKEEPKEQAQLIEKLVQGPSPEELLFKNFSLEEKTRMEEKISEQIRRYKTNVPGRADKVITNWQSSIDSILEKDVAPSEFQFWREVMAAIVYVESGGPISSPTSTAGALGPAQMIRSTAEAVAKKHGIFDIDPANGWTSIRLSRFLFEDLMQRYGRIDLTLAGYYGGQGFADQFILAALANKGVGKEDSIMKKGISSEEQLRSYIEHYRINIANLGSLDGEEYFIKTTAALRILQEERQIMKKVRG